jgi:GNAT superfamily N-acetyltransferase
MADGPALAQPLGTIWHMRLPEAPKPVEPLGPATFGPTGPEAERELAAAMGLAGSAEVRRRFEAGRRCYAARAQGILAAYGWVSFQEEVVGGLGLRLQMQPSEAYIWDCVTMPAFRRQGLYTALLGRVVQALRDEGLLGAWIGADYENQPSHAGITRAGFTVVADLVAAPPEPGQQRRRAWLQSRPGSSQGLLAEARRAYMGGCGEVWLFGTE